MSSRLYQIGRRDAMAGSERRTSLSFPLDQGEYDRGYDTFLAQKAEEESRPQPALTAEELREFILGFADIFREMIPWADEAEYREKMENAGCHRLVDIDECGHCQRQIAAHQALAKLKEAIAL